MSRILLVNLASLPMAGNEPIFPIGLRCIQDALLRSGHHVDLIDFVADPSAYDDLSWLDGDWDIVGFAIRNIDPIDLACPDHVGDYSSFVSRVRARLPENRPLIVVGGAGYSLFAETLRARLEADVGIVGPGEAIMTEIASDPGKYKDTQQVITGRPYPGFVRNALLHPASLLGAYAKLDNAMIGVETMRRTCFQKCVYCPYAYITGQNGGDHKPLELLARELEHIVNAGYKRIFLTDAIFNSQSQALPIVKMLGEERFADLTWSAYFSPKPFREEFAQALSTSGVETVVISPDSLDPHMMKRLGKNFDLDSVLDCLEKCRRHQLSPMVNIVFGGPDETEETVATTCNFANEHLRTGELSMHVGYRILPETALAAEVGLPDEELISPTFYPLSEQIVAWIVRHLDARFLTPTVMVNLMAGRAAALRMERVAIDAKSAETSKRGEYAALRRKSA